jgi:hypothetical protein
MDHLDLDERFGFSALKQDMFLIDLRQSTRNLDIFPKYLIKNGIGRNRRLSEKT